MEQIRLSTPKQILDAVPRLLGYSPVGSLVAIPLSGKRGGVVLRFDLPSASGKPTVRATSYANSVVGHLAHLKSIERVVFVLSPDQPFGAGPRPPFSWLTEELVAAAERAGIEVVLCICRATDAWGVYGCDDPDCCDIGPRALGTQRSWVEAAARPIDDSVVAPASRRRRLAFAEADERHWQLHDGEDDLPSMRRGWLTIFAPASLAASPDDARLARLLCMLRGRHTSELLLVTIAFGVSHDLLSLARVWGPVMSDDEEPQLPEFSRKRVRRAVAVLRELAALVDLEDEAGLLSGLSWLEWASGRSSAAAAFARRAIAVRPDDSLASSVVWLVERCVVPPWLSVVEEWSEEPESTSAVRREG
ncbi:hypothetical protein C5B85_02270 [Pseudoclavibacter sp. AY1F1]|uniref:DUF4192 family protein n=1 Tax=Pseudoclavibacter sp. AY1F1 TaxID=2080583 RepID=UPI000CE901E2|nr:DUF4192 family protein [Pseudoclavibacter sp. AY1F1]PPF47120.1 hypothetical protein C5B85_02270 [Pseudoclavibacter sp. AY1F1]